MIAPKTLQRLGKLGAMLALCLFVSACADKRLTRANYDKIKDGMSLAQVEDILGKGDKETGGAGGAGVAATVGIDTGVKGAGGAEMYKWGSDEKYIRIGFRGDKVIFRDIRGF